MRIPFVMKTIYIVATIAVALTACDSKQEQLRKAELEARAEKLEDASKAAKKTSETDARIVKKEGEANAEVLKEEADRVRDQK